MKYIATESYFEDEQGNKFNELKYFVDGVERIMSGAPSKVILELYMENEKLHREDGPAWIYIHEYDPRYAHEIWSWHGKEIHREWVLR